MSYSAAHYITKQARIGPLDAQVVYPALLWMLHIRLWTTVILFLSILLLWFLSSKGISVMMMSRIVRRWIIGQKREIRSAWRKHMPL